MPKDFTLQCNSSQSLANPVVTQWVDYIATQSRLGWNRQSPTVITVPAKKPYRMSKSHRKFLDAVGNTSFHEVMVTSPLGLVPRDLEETWPASHYDIPVTGNWSADELVRTDGMLKSLIERHNYHTVINHSSMDFELEGVDYIDTQQGLPATSSDALDNLRQVSGMLVKQHQLRNRKHHRFCSITSLVWLAIR